MRGLIRKISSFANNENDKIIIKNITASLIIKGSALVISLFKMPAYIRYFDNQIVLGVWFTVLSLLSWVLTFDFGLGHGLRNNLVKPIVENDKNKIKEYISSAYIIIGAVSVLILFAAYIVFPYINWNSLFNVSEELVSSTTILFAVNTLFFGIIIMSVLRLVLSVLYALQKSAVSNLITIVSSIAELLFVLLAPSYDIEINLKMLAVAHVVAANLPLLVASFVIFGKYLKGCTPSIKSFCKKAAFDILGLSGAFFYVQILFMLIASSNEFLIARYSDPVYVVDYEIYSKLFTALGLIFTLALAPLWSAVTKAQAQKDIKWIKKTYKLFGWMSLAAVVIELSMIPFLQAIVNIWLGDAAITINYGYATAFAVMGSTFVYQSVLSTFANGMGRLKVQALCYTLGFIAKLVIVHIGMRIYSGWIVVVFANLFAYALYCVVQPLFLKNYFNWYEKEWGNAAKE